MRESEFPLGWDEARMRRVLAHYEQQSEEEAVAEYEAAHESSTQTFVEIPNELLPAVRELIAKHESGADSLCPLWQVCRDRQVVWPVEIDFARTARYSTRCGS